MYYSVCHFEGTVLIFNLTKLKKQNFKGEKRNLRDFLVKYLLCPYEPEHEKVTGPRPYKLISNKAKSIKPNCPDFECTLFPNCHLFFF